MIEKRPIEGLLGQPYICLKELIDCSVFPAIDQEICFQLAKTNRNDLYSGGFFQFREIIPKFEAEKNLVDAFTAINRMDVEEKKLFFSLNKDSRSISERINALYDDYAEAELNLEQNRYLQLKYGVYFSWSRVVLLNLPGESDCWENLAASKSKVLSPETHRDFPLLSKFIESLPLESIGRVVLLGNDPFQFGMTHWDRRPDIYPEPCEFINFSPNQSKKMFLWDEMNHKEVQVESPIFWFNDADYHGVQAQPFFQYSIRIDGKFTAEFRDTIKKSFR